MPTVYNDYKDNQHLQFMWKDIEDKCNKFSCFRLLRFGSKLVWRIRQEVVDENTEETSIFKFKHFKLNYFSNKLEYYNFVVSETYCSIRNTLGVLVCIKLHWDSTTKIYQFQCTTTL